MRHSLSSCYLVFINSNTNKTKLTQPSNTEKLSLWIKISLKLKYRNDYRSYYIRKRGDTSCKNKQPCSLKELIRGRKREGSDSRRSRGADRFKNEERQM